MCCGCFYHFWKVLNNLLLWSFYQEVKIYGREKVPKEGGVIFVSNHTNGLVDAQVLFCKCPRVVRMLGKAPLFNIPVLGAAARAVGGIPVYRKEDNSGAKQDNGGMFRAVYEALASGETIGICPEGLSHDNAELQELKPGVAMMAFGARELNADTAVSILPVGITFWQKHKFRTRAHVEFGDPIPVTDALLQEYVDTKHLKRDNVGMKKLLAQIEAGLYSVTLNASDWHTFDLLRMARRMLQPRGYALSQAEYHELTRSFQRSYAQHREDASVQALREELLLYADSLKLMGVRDEDVEWGSIPVCLGLFTTLYMALYALVLFPLGLPAFIYNLPIALIAYAGAWKIASATAKSDIKRGAQQEGYQALDVVASYKIFIFLFLTPLFYAGYAVCAGYFMHGLLDLHGAIWGVCVFAALIVLSVIAVLVYDESRMSLRSMRHVCRRTCCCIGTELRELQEERYELQQKVRALAAQIGPQNCKQVWEFENDDDEEENDPRDGADTDGDGGLSSRRDSGSSTGSGGGGGIRSYRRQTTTIVSDKQRARMKAIAEKKKKQKGQGGGLVRSESRETMLRGGEQVLAEAEEEEAAEAAEAGVAGGPATTVQQAESVSINVS